MNNIEKDGTEQREGKFGFPQKYSRKKYNVVAKRPLSLTESNQRLKEFGQR